MCCPLSHIRWHIIALFLGVMATTSSAWEIIGFEEVSLPDNTASHATSADQSPLVSHGVEFNRTWSVEFDCCPGGWAASNQRDQATPGSASSFSAFVASSGGGGNASSQFAVANSYARGEATVVFPQPAHVEGMFVTNVTYTYLAVVDGNDGAGFVKGPFQDGDWLRLDAVGLDDQGNETGRNTIYLADFRDGLSSALDEWTWFDLSPLGSNVSSLEFEMSSTDTGEFGMNTPAYFAVDDLTFHIVPEPGGLAYLLLGLAVLQRAVRQRCTQGRIIRGDVDSRRLALTRTYGAT